MKNQFDFTQYNLVMKSASVGLKLHLAVQMVKEVYTSLDYFDNPLSEEIHPILTDLKAFHSMYKERAKAEQAKRENPSERNADIDNANVKQSEMAMMKMMMEMQQEIIKLRTEGMNATAEKVEQELTGHIKAA
jgi:hypothetical protein